MTRWKGSMENEDPENEDPTEDLRKRRPHTKSKTYKNEDPLRKRRPPTFLKFWRLKVSARETVGWTCKPRRLCKSGLYHGKGHSDFFTLVFPVKHSLLAEVSHDGAPETSTRVGNFWNIYCFATHQMRDKTTKDNRQTWQERISIWSPDFFFFKPLLSNCLSLIYILQSHQTTSCFFHQREIFNFAVFMLYWNCSFNFLFQLTY